MLVATLEGGQPGLDLGEIGEVVGREDLALVESSGADASSVHIFDTETGETVNLQPEGGLATNYWVTSPRFRPSDGSLSVVCCHHGESVEGDHSMNLVLHDPTTGAEETRMGLPFSARDIDWDETGLHLLIADRGRVHHYSGATFRAIPRTRG